MRALRSATWLTKAATANLIGETAAAGRKLDRLVQIGISSPPPTGLAGPKELRRFDRNVLLALGAAKEALADSGLNGFDPMRVGIVFGSAIGGLIGIVDQANTLRDRGPDRISPYFIPNVLVDTASGQRAISDLAMKRTGPTACSAKMSR